MLKLGDGNVELVAEGDDELMSEFFETGTIGEEHIVAADGAERFGRLRRCLDIENAMCMKRCRRREHDRETDERAERHADERIDTDALELRASVARRRPGT